MRNLNIQNQPKKHIKSNLKNAFYSKDFCGSHNYSKKKKKD